MFYMDRINRHKQWRHAYTKLGRLFCLRTRLWIAATGHFHLRNNKRENKLVYQSNLVGVKLFSSVDTFVEFMYITCAQRSRPAKWNYTFPPFDLFSRKQRWFWQKGRGYTTRSQTTAFCSYEKSYTFREDMSARVLKDIKPKSGFD